MPKLAETLCVEEAETRVEASQVRHSRVLPTLGLAAFACVAVIGTVGYLSGSMTTEMHASDLHSSNTVEKAKFGGFYNAEEYYQNTSKQFVGLNPRKGYGSGFFKKEGDWKSDNDWHTVDASNGRPPKTRTDLCTCDCKGSPDGVGCVGFGGIAFRYVSLLANTSGEWSGQMVAMDCGAANGGRCNVTDPKQTYFQFMGKDRREYPGGMAIYSVATTLAITGDKIGGVFRQANDPVSCVAGVQDKADYEAGKVEGKNSCFYKCGDGDTYKQWLDYCSKTEDTSGATGFSGWGK